MLFFGCKPSRSQLSALSPLLRRLWHRIYQPVGVNNSRTALFSLLGNTCESELLLTSSFWDLLWPCSIHPKLSDRPARWKGRQCWVQYAQRTQFGHFLAWILTFERIISKKSCTNSNRSRSTPCAGILTASARNTEFPWNIPVVKGNTLMPRTLKITD